MHKVPYEKNMTRSNYTLSYDYVIYQYSAIEASRDFVPVVVLVVAVAVIVVAVVVLVVVVVFDLLQSVSSKRLDCRRFETFVLMT